MSIGFEIKKMFEMEIKDLIEQIEGEILHHPNHCSIWATWSFHSEELLKKKAKELRKKYTNYDFQAWKENHYVILMGTRRN